jgi:competence protein ComEC
MKRSPLITITLAFIIGILAGRCAGISFIVFSALSLSTLILSLLFLKSKSASLLFIVLSICFLGGAAYKNSQDLPRNHISNFTPYKAKRVYVEGVISSDPVVKTKSSSFILKAEKMGKGKSGRDICGDILVRAFGRRDLCYGDRLYLEGSLYKIPYFRISKRLNYRKYMELRHIYSTLNVSKSSIIRVLEKGGGNPLKRFVYRLRHKIDRIIEKEMSPYSASILSAIILGERHNLSDHLREAMVRSGTVHIIAISGLHVGLVSLIVLIALKMMRIPGRLCYTITIFVLIMYCVLTGARTPVVRVTIMALIVFFGYIIDRRANIYNVLAAAALPILLYNPHQLFNISFQLSFVSVLSISGLSPKIDSFLFSKIKKSSRMRILATLFSASLAAWIGLLPLIGYYFDIVSPIAILANMIVVPYLSIIIGTGLLSIIIGLVFPTIAANFFAACELSIQILVKFISLMIKVPGAYFYIS